MWLQQMCAAYSFASCYINSSTLCAATQCVRMQTMLSMCVCACVPLLHVTLLAAWLLEIVPFHALQLVKAISNF